MTQQELKNGKAFTFSNEEWCEANGSDDVRSAEVLFEDSKHSWATGFKIWFNGELIHSSKTFTSMKSRFEKLAAKWSLQATA